MKFCASSAKSSDQIIESLQKLITEERCLTHEILAYLIEVEARRIYAERGYSSLFRFCVDFLGYSDGAAYRRIEAMRMLKSTPELENKIKQGQVNLSTVSLVGAFVKEESRELKKTFSPTERLEIIQSVEKKSKREVEKILTDLKLQNRAHVGVAAPVETEIKLKVSQGFLDKLTRLKELRPGKKDAELLEMTLDALLNRIDPEIKAKVTLNKAPPTSPEKSKKNRESNSSSVNHNPIRSHPATSHPINLNSTHSNSINFSSTDLNSIFSKHTPNRTPSIRSRYIPAPIKHHVWLRDKGLCTYRDPKTHKQCCSKYGLEFEHLTPFAKGGAHSTQNLTLRCRTHNQWSALKNYGPQKMEKYLRKSS